MQSYTYCDWVAQLRRTVTPFLITLLLSAGIPNSFPTGWTYCPVLCVLCSLWYNSGAFWICHNPLYKYTTTVIIVTIYYFLMKCLGCNGNFKSETGLIHHLSNKPLCQAAMGMSIPPMHPPKRTLSLDPPHLALHTPTRSDRQCHYYLMD